MRRLPVVVVAVSVVVALGGAGAAWVLISSDGDSEPAVGPDGDLGGTRPSTTTSLAPPTTASNAPDNAESTAALEVAQHPDDAEALAGVIVESEARIRDRAVPPETLEPWARVQQAAYRELARRPEWDGLVEAAIPQDLVPVVRANTLANRELWELTDPRDALPDWRIVEPPPVDELLTHYRNAEAEFGVPWEYLAAIHLVESRMGRIRGDSVAGARGPMQFLPSTWEAYGEGDIEDAGDAIRAAARYLVASGAPGDIPRALFAYNHSDHYVTAIEAHARVMEADERAYYGYYHWQVYYRLVSGDVLLEVGWTNPQEPQEDRQA